MVDISGKPESDRSAVAKGIVLLSAETLQAARSGDLKKGDLRAAAELAGVMGGKRTAELIPLCHPIPLSHLQVQVEFQDEPPAVTITASARTTANTGVEMEALTAVAVAGLTVYDMCKSLDRGMRLSEIELLHKSGGKSGVYAHRDYAAPPGGQETQQALPVSPQLPGGGGTGRER